MCTQCTIPWRWNNRFLRTFGTFLLVHAASHLRRRWCIRISTWESRTSQSSRKEADNLAMMSICCFVCVTRPTCDMAKCATYKLFVYTLYWIALAAVFPQTLRSCCYVLRLNDDCTTPLSKSKIIGFANLTAWEINGCLERRKSLLGFKVFWRLRVTLRFNAFLDFAHRPEFWIPESSSIWESGTDSVLRWGEGDTYFVRSLRKS
jgi:hypothetical protein